MMIRSYSLCEIAISQLETAMKLYSQGEYFCAITLAGAAEEILGQLARREGKKLPVVSMATSHALIKAILAREQVESISEEDMRLRVSKSMTFLNKVKNSIKHLSDGEPASVDCDPKQEAEEMIWRGISGFRLLEFEFSESMCEFIRGYGDPWPGSRRG